VEEPAEADDRRWLSFKFPLTDDHGVAYALGGISTDITDRKRAEAAAREARDEAERANRAKSEFLSRMSHELRTPLNAILGFGQLLALETLPDTAQPSVARILRAGQHLLALINEVLELARIEAGALRFAVEPVHAPAPLAEALELTRPLARERGIELSADMHGGMHRYCIADRQRLIQALLNLLANAVKYNRPGGVVRVLMREDEQTLRYLVTDTGPGLDADGQVRAFLPFERLTADGSEVEGTGLGLALSRSLIEGMGGSLGIQHSAPGEGSTFFVELALSAAPPEAAGEAGAISRGVSWDLPRATVLYVEDNLSNIELVRGILSRMPAVELIPAMQGSMAVDLAAQHRPDVILLDLNLPDLGGDEVLRRLRADARTNGIPVVVLSADATPATIARLNAGGITGYVTKPLDIAEFVGALRTAVAA
jgi:signal transduction histidine kinase/CheY-like chemotaxis protein